MDIGSLSGILQTLYATQGIGTANLNSSMYFNSYMQNALQRMENVFTAGDDVVMGYPPAGAANYQVDGNKTSDEMTLDEYKRYLCNKVSRLPASTSMRLYGSGTLIFKEEALQSMKDNPQYEEYVMDMLKERFSEEIPYYSSGVKCQVIGSSAEECYNVNIPMARNYSGTYGLQSAFSSYGLYGTSYNNMVSAYKNTVSAHRNTASERRERTHTRLFGRSWSV